MNFLQVLNNKKGKKKKKKKGTPKMNYTYTTTNLLQVLPMALY